MMLTVLHQADLVKRKKRKNHYHPEFHERLRAAILERHASIERFAMAAGLRPGEVYRWCKNVEPSREKLIELCALLEKLPGELAF